MKKLALAFTLCAALAAPTAPRATPTTTVWAPATTAVQGFLVPHLTYDTYFWGRGASGSTSSPIYPVTTGVTMGVLPSETVNLELGFDLLLPANDPFLFNAKLGIPEDKLLAWHPSLAVGIFGVGTRSDVTNYNILYAQLQHSLPGVGGFLSVGGYYGLTESLLRSSDGRTQRAGFMGSVASPDITIGKDFLKKIVLAADVQTGDNAFGAVGGGASFYFTDTVAVLTGPVYFFDKGLQPGGSQLMWTLQLDVDLPLRTTAAVAPGPAGK